MPKVKMCLSCNKVVECITGAIRLYRRREERRYQVQYCSPCWQALIETLKMTSRGEERSLFDPPSDALKVRARV